MNHDADDDKRKTELANKKNSEVNESAALYKIMLQWSADCFPFSGSFYLK